MMTDAILDGSADGIFLTHLVGNVLPHLPDENAVFAQVSTFLQDFPMRRVVDVVDMDSDYGYLYGNYIILFGRTKVLGSRTVFFWDGEWRIV